MLSSLFSNPIDTILSFLLTVPGLLLALCAHEAAHGLAAYLCGDPTAKMMGRVTLNPARHLDPMGTLCMLLFRFGWAKPVPVNPYNFRNPRRDDLIVSLAGITANLLMCLAGCVIMYIPLTMALRGWGGQYYDCAQFYHYAYGMSDLIREAYGAIPCYLYEIVAIFSILNLSLAFFNLLPIPPLDGYHVLNDLILRNSDPFAGQRAARIGQVVILLILFVPQLSDLFDTLRTAVFDAVFGSLGNAVYGLLQLTGVM